MGEVESRIDDYSVRGPEKEMSYRRKLTIASSQKGN
jgi:hypothetical protein